MLIFYQVIRKVNFEKVTIGKLNFENKVSFESQYKEKMN